MGKLTLNNKLYMYNVIHQYTEVKRLFQYLRALVRKCLGTKTLLTFSALTPMSSKTDVKNVSDGFPTISVCTSPANFLKNLPITKKYSFLI